MRKLASTPSNSHRYQNYMHLRCRGLEIGEVMVSRNQPLNKVIDLMKKNGLDEEGAAKRIINLGIQDYVAELYKDGEISSGDLAAQLPTDV